jgi:hypothetical protein
MIPTGLTAGRWRAAFVVTMPAASGSHRFAARDVGSIEAMSDQRTTPNERTKQAERAERNAEHGADRAPTPDEEKVARSQDDLDPEVAEDYREMTRRGADSKGEGRIP